jgi:hypothetical protein
VVVQEPKEDFQASITSELNVWRKIGAGRNSQNPSTFLHLAVMSGSITVVSNDVWALKGTPLGRDQVIGSSYPLK